MNSFKPVVLFLFAAASMHAQFTGGISQSASRTVTVPPDEAVFSISVNTTLETTFDTLLGILQKVGEIGRAHV